MPTPKKAIAEALQSLDHKNDTLWTDDGAPLVSEIQRITNDTTITRAQINDALPGFARKTNDSVAEDVQPGDDPDDILDDEIETQAGGPRVAPASEVQAEPGSLSPEQEHERLRQLAFGRVQRAAEAISAAKDAVSVAIANVTKAEQAHSRALQLFSAKYPPLTSAENIKQHLKRQQEILRERLTGSRFEPNPAQNPVDASLMDRKRNNGRANVGRPPASYLPKAAVGR